jgi:ubiquitin carboxyl-terminal hydrolase 5/13
LIPLFGPGYTGMENIGNSCYMNSVVQILFSIPEFKEKYLKEANDHLKSCTKFTPECISCQISKLVEGLWSGRYSVKKEAKKVEYEGQTEEEKNRIDYVQDGIRPHMFKNLIGKGHQEF